MLQSYPHQRGLEPRLMPLIPFKMFVMFAVAYGVAAAMVAAGVACAFGPGTVGVISEQHFQPLRLIELNSRGIALAAS
jgi:hypothetical protein